MVSAEASAGAPAAAQRVAVRAAAKEVHAASGFWAARRSSIGSHWSALWTNNESGSAALP